MAMKTETTTREFPHIPNSYVYYRGELVSSVRLFKASERRDWARTHAARVLAAHKAALVEHDARMNAEYATNVDVADLGETDWEDR